MILLDTNIISELMRGNPSSPVFLWVDKQAQSKIWTTSLTLYELSFGIECLPVGRRRRELASLLAGLLAEVIEGRIAAFDRKAALLAATLDGQRKKTGVIVSQLDTLIAGIALAHGATLATRNTRDFKDAGITLINPFEAV